MQDRVLDSGASSFTTCGAVSYGKAKAYAVLGETFPTPKPSDAEDYKAKRDERGAFKAFKDTKI